MERKEFFVIGNWKSNKSIPEAESWLYEFHTLLQKKSIPDTTKVILCPSFIHLAPIGKLIRELNLPVELCVQNVSSFSSGAYTGEVNAQQVKDLVSYGLIGHSERRKYFQETDYLLEQKVLQLKGAGIEPIYCVQNDQQSFPEECTFIAYEPVWAIGTGTPDKPENANRVTTLLKSRAKKPIQVIYGGSVTDMNVSQYFRQTDIDGVLPGGASLKAESFYRLIQNACL